MDVLFQALVENSTDAVVMVNADGTIRFASEPSARLLGYSTDERLGRSAFELLHPDDAERTRQTFENCLRHPGMPFPAEYRMRHKEGSYRYIEAVAVNRLDEPAVGAIVVNYRDVTERRQAERALRESEQRLRQIVENAQDLIYYCDPNGHLTYVNAAAARVLHYEAHELLGRHFLTIIRSDYQGAAAEVYTRQIVERLPTTYFEFPAVTKTGGELWVGQHVQLVYNDDKIIAVHAIARDITRQKNAEERLRRSEARYRSLIQGAAYGIYRSTADGVILDANPALARILGYESVADLTTRNMRDFYRTAADRAHLIHLSSTRESVAGDVWWLRKDGRPILVHLTARMVEVEEGVKGFEGIAEDITEKRALEEQLRQAQKMEAVGRLARGVAHDFNNVLAAIIGSSDLLALKLAENDSALEEADEIRKAAERGASLTRQLTAFSRAQVVEPSILDLAATVTDMTGMLERLAGDDVTLTVRTEGPARVRVQASHLEQVLLNLVVNARDAMPDGGSISIVVEPIELDEQAALKYPGIPAGSYGRIAVTDSGVGIAPDLQPFVFEPFFTTKGPSKGTGLGLSIVYGIAKEYGGATTFSTSAEHGTTFEVLLPLVPGATT
jgi:two-component system, cell cycle sensor histidine kinase and response regulator CckA